MPKADTYKEIFEIGKRLQAIAEEAGYGDDSDPTDEGSNDESDSTDSSDSSSSYSGKKDKFAIAEAIMNKK